MFSAAREGLRRATAHPFLVLGLWLVTLVYGGFLAWQVGHAIAHHLGPSLRAERLVKSFDLTWYEEFHDQSNGLARSFGPTITRGGPILDALETWLDGSFDRFGTPFLAALIGFALLWTFLHGGVIETLRDRSRVHRLSDYFAACAHYFGRLFVLNLFSAVYLWATYRWIAPHLFNYIKQMTRNEIVEWKVILVTFAGYKIIFILLMLGFIIFEGARIISVIGDRMNPLSSIARAAGLMGRTIVPILGLLLIVGILESLVMSVFAWLNPGGGPSALTTLILYLVATQIYLIVRWWLRMALTGGLIMLAETRHYGRPADLY